MPDPYLENSMPLMVEIAYSYEYADFILQFNEEEKRREYSLYLPNNTFVLDLIGYIRYQLL